MAENEQPITEKIIEEVDARTWKERVLQVFKSEGFKIGGGIFFAISLVVFALPLFLNNSALKFQLAQKVSQISAANFTINGNVEIALLPSPAIIANDVLLQNYKSKSGKIYNLYAKSAVIKFPIFNFSEDVSAKKIILRDMVLEGYDADFDVTLRQNKITEVAAEFVSNSGNQKANLGSGLSAKLFSISEIDVSKFKTVNIPALVIENGYVVFYDKFARKKEIKSINLETKMRATKIAAEGSFNSEDILSNFTLLAKFNSSSDKPDSFLEVVSPVAHLRISGNFFGENNGLLSSDFSGKIEAEILELKSFYRSYIDANGVISAKLKYNAKPININADIENKSYEIAIKNLKFNSSLVNGTGDISLSFSNKIPLIDIGLNLDDLDFDSLWSGEAVAVIVAKNDENIVQEISADEVESLPQTIASAPEKKEEMLPPEEKSRIVAAAPEEPKKLEPIDFNLTKKIKDFDLTAEIKIKTIKYFEGEIKDANLYLTVSKEGQILVLPLIFKVPGEGIFRVNGALDNSASQPKFVGKFDASGKSLKEIFKWLKIESQNLKFDNLKEYGLYSDVLLFPNSIAFNNFYLNLNNGSSEFLGELKIDNSGKVPNMISRFQVSYFDFDEFFLTSGQNAYLSPGMLLRKLLWLNDISSNNDIKLSFDKMIYKKEEFPDQSMKLRFGRGYLEVSDLSLKSDKTNLKANLSLDISDKNPKFDIKIDAKNFHYETVYRTELLTEEKSLEAPEAEVPTSYRKVKSRNFFDQFFSLPSFEGFNGKISFNFDNLEIDGIKMQNVKMDGKLKDGNIEGTNLGLDLYGGSLAYKGLIGIKLVKTINGNLTFNDASLQPLLSDLFGIKNVEGVINISSSVTAVASKKEEFSKQLTSEIKFNANSPSVAGYGLNDLVKKMFSPQIYHSELMNPEKTLLNSQAKTIFKQASGTIQVTNGKEGQFRMNVAAPAINGIFSGTLNLENNAINGLFNVIFLTGNRQKQSPINIATNVKGPMDSLSQNTNLDQVRQYLGLAKVRPETVASEAETANLIPTQNNKMQENSVVQNVQPAGESQQNQALQAVQVPQQNQNSVPAAQQNQVIQPAQIAPAAQVNQVPQAAPAAAATQPSLAQ